MSEASLLSLVCRYPHPAVLARRVACGRALFPTRRRLEAQGLVVHRGELYRLTRRGRRELAFERALARVVAR